MRLLAALAAIILSLSLTRGGHATRITVDFSGLPGPDGIPGTADDVPFSSRDFAYQCSGSECPGDQGRRIGDQYAGVHFCPGNAVETMAGGFKPDGSPGGHRNAVLLDVPVATEAPLQLSPVSPLFVTFDTVQTEIVVDILAFLHRGGTSVPVTLRDASGQVVKSFVLTNADAILGGGNPRQLGGRFRITSVQPFASVELGLSGPSCGGIAIDNLTFDQAATSTTIVTMCPTIAAMCSTTTTTVPPTTTTTVPPTTTTTVPPPPPFSCGSAPESGCLPGAPQKAQLQLGSGKLTWKWTSSAAVASADFGSPPTTTDYLLCIYDASAEKLSAQVPADRMCGTKPCWNALRTGVGFRYSDKTGTPDGLMKLLLKAGDAGKGKIGVKGGGVNLHLPTLPLTTPVRVQLRQSGSGVCWQATYSTAITNTASRFKAKSD